MTNVKISGWTAADYSGRSVRILNHSSRCVPGITGKNVIEIDDYYQFLFRSGQIPEQKSQIKNNFQAAIVSKNTNEEFQLSKLIRKKFSTYNHLDPNSILIINNVHCPFILLRQLYETKSPYIFLSQAKDFIIETIENFPCNWQEGLLVHAKVKFKYSSNFTIPGFFLKQYLSKWKQPIDIITNIESLNSEEIRSITKALPVSFLS